MGRSTFACLCSYRYFLWIHQGELASALYSTGSSKASNLHISAGKQRHCCLRSGKLWHFDAATSIHYVSAPHEWCRHSTCATVQHGRACDASLNCGLVSCPPMAWQPVPVQRFPP